MKFGDGISWEQFAEEILQGNDDTYFSFNGKDVFEDANEHIKTDTPIDERKVIDCGCNLGRWVDVLVKYGFKYTGVDQSSKSIEIAKSARPNHTWICLFLWDLPFESEFDFALSNNVLQHNLWEEQDRVVAGIYKVLKPGGVFFMEESTVHEPTKTQRTHNGWIDMIERHGFKFIKALHINSIGLMDRYMFIKKEPE